MPGPRNKLRIDKRGNGFLDEVANLLVKILLGLDGLFKPFIGLGSGFFRPTGPFLYLLIIKQLQKTGATPPSPHTIPSTPHSDYPYPPVRLLLPPCKITSTPLLGYSYPLVRLPLPPCQITPTPLLGYSYPLVRLRLPPCQVTSTPLSGYLYPSVRLPLPLCKDTPTPM